MPDKYTHTVKFEVNGSFIKGECGFGNDIKTPKRSSIKIDPEGISQPLSFEILNKFGKWIEAMKSLDNDYGGIKEITVKLK